MYMNILKQVIEEQKKKEEGLELKQEEPEEDILIDLNISQYIPDSYIEERKNENASISRNIFTKYYRRIRRFKRGYKRQIPEDLEKKSIIYLV